MSTVTNDGQLQNNCEQLVWQIQGNFTQSRNYIHFNETTSDKKRAYPSSTLSYFPSQSQGILLFDGLLSQGGGYLNVT